MRAVRAVGVLLTMGCALSCGRIGYGLLGQASDAGIEGGSATDGPRADASGSGEGGREAAADGAPAAGDAVAEANLPDAETEATTTPPAEAGPDGAAVDAGPYPSCTSIAQSWVFTFTSDPTTYDGNGDGIPDWTVRGGGAFPVNELDGGVWWSASPTPLDTRPLDDFSKRVIVDVRFLSATVAASNRGAVFWINLNEDGPQFSALFASAVAQADGGQALTLFGKPDASAEEPIASFANLPSTFLNLHLDVDPATLQVGLWIDQTFEGTYSLPSTGAPNTDHFATLLSWTGLSAFASVSIVECAN